MTVCRLYLDTTALPTAHTGYNEIAAASQLCGLTVEVVLGATPFPILHSKAFMFCFNQTYTIPPSSQMFTLNNAHECCAFPCSATTYLLLPLASLPFVLHFCTRHFRRETLLSLSFSGGVGGILAAEPLKFMIHVKGVQESDDVALLLVSNQHGIAQRCGIDVLGTPALGRDRSQNQLVHARRSAPDCSGHYMRNNLGTNDGGES